ncbi:MucB/RseB [Shewanella sp. WXL01]|uniref:MucB/RseB n=1 Tax=Shewanella maritima TaxID=2520507 RepID=A0A411PK30_9GAMM|nr:MULTISPECIES: MucB/RseB C-terminal domain-containing protein [Shewanella]NKF50947.1 MucB/RseB [Shewanella sp. WXL01]QBF83915.1 MucB/RseB [Shewanella maritima]
MRVFLLALLFISCSSLANEDIPAKAWLDKMSHALQEQQFKASIIQLQSNHIRPLVYIHGIVEDKPVAFLEYLNGPPKNAVRVEDQVTFIEHDQPPYSVRSPRIQGVWPMALAASPERLAQGYEFVLGGRSRIAGRPGQMIRLIAKDDYRYDAQVWVDMATYLPLRFDIVNRDKQLLEQMMVIELIELDEPASILVEAYKQEWPPVMNLAERNQAQNWQFNWLPQGFEMLVKDNHRLIGSQEQVEYIALSDGLTNVSVYVTLAKESPMPEELVTRNGLSMVTEVVGNAEVVVVGKMPAESLQKIARSLVLQ